ncbi:MULTISPECIES: hypothetical protein [unclassified Pseudomonas]|uniref:hypothetical protein n=1 Tax=Pseudomonas TaxID=286 RepID=UPI0004B024B2|nr:MULTISPECIES: hypothetical protein [unclassified Pseudomonas]
MKSKIDAPKKQMMLDLSLSDLAPEISPTSGYDTSATVLVISSMRTEPSLQTISIPTWFEKCPIARCLISYLNSDTLKTKSRHDAYAKLTRTRAIFEWASVEYAGASKFPTGIFGDYCLHLKNKGVQESSACAYMSSYRIPIDWYIEQHHADPSRAEIINSLRAARSYIPSLPNKSERTQASLSQITEQPIDDELKIVQSTIRFCCAFLEKMQEQRTALLSDPGVSQKLQELIQSCEGDYLRLKWSSHDSKRSTVYKPLAAYILDSDDLSLKERLLWNQVQWAYQTIDGNLELSKTAADQKIRDGLRITGALDIQPDDTNRILYFKNIDYLSLIKHTPAEEICFAWLLATDRVQLAGLLKMSIDDLRITMSSASPIFEKGRSAEKIREVPMHSSKSLQYQAYVSFKKLKESFFSLFPSHGNKLIEIPTTSTLQCLNSEPYSPLIMACHEHTSTYNDLQLKEPGIKIFANIVRCVAANNRIFHKNNRKAKDDIYRQTISVTNIAQSRAILDLDESDLDNIPYEKYGQEVVDASATAHSPQVKRIKYIYASTTKYRLGKRAAFAATVGSAMVDDARKVIDSMAGNVFMGMKEFKVMLGWSTDIEGEDSVAEFDQLLLSARDAGYEITPTAQLKRGGTTYIITNPVSAALLLDYKQACVELLRNTPISEEARATSLVMQTAYIEACLEKFDRKTISLGQGVLDKSSFPKPVVR